VLYLSLTKLYSAASFTRAPHYFTPSFTYVEEQQLFPNTAKTLWLDIFGYSSVSGIQCFPPLATRLPRIRRSVSRPKSEKVIKSLKGLGYAIFGNFSTDQIVIELTKISK